MGAQYSETRRSARRRGKAFDLSPDAFKTLKSARRCFYCNAVRADSAKPYGIDRVNNAVGYLEGNCVPCCSTCNFMKGTLDIARFIRQCRLVARATSCSKENQHNSRS